MRYFYGLFRVTFRLCLTAISSLFVVPVVIAETQCPWNLFDETSCNCSAFGSALIKAERGDKNSQFEVWVIMNTYGDYGIYGARYFRPAIIKELMQDIALSEVEEECSKSLKWKQKEKLQSDSIQWLIQAAQSGHVRAQYYYDRYLYENRRSLKPEPVTKEDVIFNKLNNMDIEGKYKILPWGETVGEWEVQYREHIDWANSQIFDNEYLPEIEKYIRKAAESGHIKAQFMLADILTRGVGADIRLVEAAAWSMVAVEQNAPFGKAVRDEYLRKLTNEEELEAQAMYESLIRKYTKLMDNPSHTILH